MYIHFTQHTLVLSSQFVDKHRITKDSPYYRKDPKMHHRIHCVAFVVDANNDPDYPITGNVQEQIKKAQEIMNQKGMY